VVNSQPPPPVCFQSGQFRALELVVPRTPTSPTMIRRRRPAPRCPHAVDGGPMRVAAPDDRGVVGEAEVGRSPRTNTRHSGAGPGPKRAAVRAHLAGVDDVPAAVSVPPTPSQFAGHVVNHSRRRRRARPVSAGCHGGGAAPPTLTVSGGMSKRRRAPSWGGGGGACRRTARRGPTRGGCAHSPPPAQTSRRGAPSFHAPISRAVALPHRRGAGDPGRRAGRAAPRSERLARFFVRHLPRHSSSSR